MKEKRNFVKDLKKLEKEQKKQAMSEIINKFNNAKTAVFKEDADLNELKIDVFQVMYDIFCTFLFFL